MNDERNTNVISRRQLVGWAAGGMAMGLLPLAGLADGDKSTSSKSSSSLALASSGVAGKKVVVVGGGMAGMTVAKYLRLWGGSGLQVTLVEPDTVYTSSIMSNLVLNGSRTVASLQFTRDALSSRYGVSTARSERAGATSAIVPTPGIRCDGKLRLHRGRTRRL